VYNKIHPKARNFRPKTRQRNVCVRAFLRSTLILRQKALALGGKICYNNQNFIVGETAYGQNAGNRCGNPRK
jgi:hypothetical protein